MTTSDDSNLQNILTQHPYWILFYKFDQINNGPIYLFLLNSLLQHFF